RVEERRLEERLAVVEGRPEITVGAGLSWERQTLTDHHGDSSLDQHQRWHGRLSVPIPLWQRNQAPRARAAAERALADADDARLAYEIRVQVEAAARRLEDAARAHQLYRGRSAQMRADLARVREAYRDGRIPLDSYLAEKGRLTEALISEWDAEAAYWSAHAALEAAVASDLA